MPTSRVKAVRQAIETHVASAISGVVFSYEPIDFSVIAADQFPHCRLLVHEEPPERLDFQQERRRIVGQIAIAIRKDPTLTAEANREAIDLEITELRDALFADPYLTNSVDSITAELGRAYSGPHDPLVYGVLDFSTDEVF